MKSMARVESLAIPEAFPSGSSCRMDQNSVETVPVGSGMIASVFCMQFETVSGRHRACV